MERCIAVFLLSVFGLGAFAQTIINPPGSVPESCIETVKGYLSSSEYNSTEGVEQIRNACIEVDTRCVQLVGDSLSSHERREAEQFLPLVRSCSGRGKADCYSSILDSVPSFDRGTAAQAANLLKKCEASKP